MVSTSHLGHGGVGAVDGPAGRPPATGGAQNPPAALQPEPLGGMQGDARAGVPRSGSAIRRLFWRLVLATPQQVERMLAWSR